MNLDFLQKNPEWVSWDQRMRTCHWGRWWCFPWIMRLIKLKERKKAIKYSTIVFDDENFKANWMHDAHAPWLLHNIIIKRSLIMWMACLLFKYFRNWHYTAPSLIAQKLGVRYSRGDPQFNKDSENSHEERGGRTIFSCSQGSVSC